LEQGGARAVLASDPALTATGSVDGAGRRRAAGYDSWFDGAWGRHAFTIEARALLRELGELGGRDLLDVGCGSGRFTALFEERGAVCTGLDSDPAMLELAGRRVHGRLLVGDAHRLPFPAASFDLAVATTVLEFAAEPALVVAEMARVTRPGGRLVVGALNPSSPWGLAHRRRLRGQPWTRARFISRDELRHLAAPYGRATLRAALFAPGAVPGLGLVGPLLEITGRAFPGWGAFQVLKLGLHKE
jgi:ubiquinone/menaquinone biosynthesis C-methylase UbiE